MVPCLACQKSSSNPLNFLLNCISCANSWHHSLQPHPYNHLCSSLLFFSGCHSPPVSDNELVAIIKAFNAAAKHNPAAKLIWKCGICAKIKNSVGQQNQKSIAVKKATPRQFAAPQNAIVIDDDDDDEIIALDGPPDVLKRNETTNPEIVHLSNTQRSTQVNFPHSRPRSSNAASYDHNQSPPQGRTSGIKDKQVRIVDDPFLPDFSAPPAKPPQTASSSKIPEFVDLTISSDEGEGSDDALEYLTPPPTSKQVVEVVHEEAPQILTSNQAHPSPRDDALPTAQTSTLTNTPQLLNLLTRWLNDRHTSVGVKPDIWARACLRRDQDAANRSSGNKTASISQPSRRKKFKALKISESSLTHSQATVFLSAEDWLHEKGGKLAIGIASV